jgi:hypothetical protein
VARLCFHRSWRAMISLPQSSGRTNPVEIDRTGSKFSTMNRPAKRESVQFDQFQPDLGAQKIVVGLL